MFNTPVTKSAGGWNLVCPLTLQIIIQCIGMCLCSPVPGSSHNISKNDPGVQNAVLVSTYTFNNESNDIFFFRVYAIKVAQIQIVKGIKYVLEVTISRTICRKSMSPPSLDKCPFQPEGALQQMFNCHFEVWAIPWKHWSKVTSFVCHPPSPPSASSTN
uniref:Cystatin domain-containing protein n=1 Tax=Paramormyrops kingsleyae TaxID=1676925 RepID=A0A3B3S9Q3_9TELE